MKEVVVVALCGMMIVEILGAYYDHFFREPRIEIVECGVDIKNMARKLNVTLLGSCEVLR